MCQLIETLQIKNGEIQLLSYHQKRMDTSIFALLKIKNTIKLDNVISIQNDARRGIWKCRIVYNTSIEEITYTPYQFRKINSLKLIENNDITYNLKFEDRNILQNLLKTKGNADEILIVKNGFITDTSFSNIAFFDGKTWDTPHTFLLKGTKRTYLLETNQIKEKSIHKDSLSNYKKARLLNCFYDLENGNDIMIENIQ